MLYWEEQERQDKLDIESRKAQDRARRAARKLAKAQAAAAQAPPPQSTGIFAFCFFLLLSLLSLFDCFVLTGCFALFDCCRDIVVAFDTRSGCHFKCVAFVDVFSADRLFFSHGFSLIVFRARPTASEQSLAS